MEQDNDVASRNKIRFIPKVTRDGIVKEDMFGDQFICTVEKLVRSKSRRLFWTTKWEPAVPYHSTYLEKFITSDDDEFDAGQFIIIRPKELILSPDEIAIASQSAESLEEFVRVQMNNNLISIRFYDGDSSLREGRVSRLQESRERLMSNAGLSSRVSRGTVVYKFPDLHLIQRDYIYQFFLTFWEQLFDEQEEDLESFDPSSYDPRRANLPMPSNYLLGKFVTAMFLQESGKDYYLIFGYESWGSDSIDCDDELEITMYVEVDHDDEIGPDDEDHVITDELGISSVFYSLALTHVYN